MLLQCLGNASAMPLQRLCNASAMPLQRLCNDAFAVPLQYLCNAFVASINTAVPTMLASEKSSHIRTSWRLNFQAAFYNGE